MIPRHVVIATSILLSALVGLGLYAFRLKQRAEQLQHRATDSRPIAPPVTGPTEQVTLLAASDVDGRLHRITVSAPMPSEHSDRARQIIRTLLDYYLGNSSQHRIPERSDVNAIYIVGDSLAVIDMNAAFADAHPSSILNEELSLSSIAQTLSANMPSVIKVKILIDGKERETLAGHADLKSVYEVSSFNSFVDATSPLQTGHMPQAAR